MNRIIFFIISILACFSISAHAEYYIVYPASMAEHTCYACTEHTSYHHVYARRHAHHHHHHIYHASIHRRSHFTITVYYPESPCADVARCASPYYYRSAEPFISDDDPCRGGEEQCYTSTSDDDYVDDRATADDMDDAELQIGNN